MKSMKLNWSMMLRRRIGSLLTMLLVTVTTVFLLLYPGLIAGAETELAQAYESVEVSGWLINAGGYDDPLVPPETYEAILDTGFVKGHCAYSYVTFGMVDQALSMMRMEDPKLFDKTRDELMQVLKQKLRTAFPGYPNTLYGLNCADAEATFSRIQDEVEWLDGYSVSDLEGNELFAVFPISSGYELGDEAEIILQHKKGYQETGSEVREIASIKVAGLYGVSLGEMSGGINMKAYCPLGAMQKLLSANQWEFCIRNFSFTLQNNRELARFKDNLTELGLDRDGAVRAAVDDRILQGATAPIQKNIDLLRDLYAFLYALVALMGFLVCFLLSRGRKAEYAVMRMLGESRLRVTGKALLEQAALCALGIGLGLLVMLFLPGRENRLGWGSLCALAGCYCAGAALAVFATVRVNVMTILQAKE